MRSVRIRTTGGPEVLRVDEVPPPREPRGDELLVRVHASSVNGTDLGLRRGDLAALTAIRRPCPLGFDLAGLVVGRGPAVTGFEDGDRVAALIGHGGGAQSDLVLVRQGRAARVPDEVPLTSAGALPLAGLTALQALHGAGGLHLRPQPRVLVLGASGGIGVFAVQLAARADASVTAVTTARTAQLVQDLGADEVLDRHRVDALASGERWDVILDSPGRVRLRDAAPALRPGGVLVSTRGLPELSLLALRGRARGPRAVAVRTAARSLDLAHLLRLVAASALRVPVHGVFPVERVADAHAAAESGGSGKVVVRLGDEDDAG